MAKGSQDWTFLARLERDQLTGDVTLRVVEDTTTVELHEGDEFVTIKTVVDLFPKP